MAHSQYIDGLAVQLELACPEGVPSAATVELLDPDTGSLGAAVSATLPTAAATVTTEAGARARGPLEVDDTTGLRVGQRALAVATTGHRREVLIEGLTASEVYLADHLQFAMAVGAQVVDHVVTHDAGTLPRKRGYRARWVLTVDGRTVVRHTAFDVVRQPIELHIEESDLKAIAPRIATKLGDDWRLLVGGALQVLDFYFQSKGRSLDQLRDTSVLKVPAVYWIMHQAAIDGALGGWYDERMIKHWAEISAQHMHRLNSAKFWLDVNDNGIRDETEAARERPLERPSRSRSLIL